VASTEARLRSFMRDLPEPSAAPPESPEYSGTPETQPCSGGSHPSRGERYSKPVLGAGDDAVAISGVAKFVVLTVHRQHPGGGHVLVYELVGFGRQAISAAEHSQCDGRSGLSPRRDQRLEHTSSRRISPAAEIRVHAVHGA
jgi:hypothetical protein